MRCVGWRRCDLGVGHMWMAWDVRSGRGFQGERCLASSCAAGPPRAPGDSVFTGGHERGRGCAGDVGLPSAGLRPLGAAFEVDLVAGGVLGEGEAEDEDLLAVDAVCDQAAVPQAEVESAVVLMPMGTR